MAQRVSKNTGRVFQPGKPLSIETRLNIISDLETNGGAKGNLALPRGLPTRVAQKYRVERNTIYNLWRRYCLDGDIRPRPRAHRQRIVSKEDIEYAQSFRTQKPDCHLKTIRENLLKRSSKLETISISTVSRMVNQYASPESEYRDGSYSDGHPEATRGSGDRNCDFERGSATPNDNVSSDTRPTTNERLDTSTHTQPAAREAGDTGVSRVAIGGREEREEGRVPDHPDVDNTALSQYVALWNIWQARNWSMMYPYMQSVSPEGGDVDVSVKSKYFKPVYMDLGPAAPEQNEALDLSLHLSQSKVS
ncbi:hypothetical protein ScPMuIL_003173 [Solemya velum]